MQGGIKGGLAPFGYTIVETMIVLAVSGVMFLMAATFVNGKQAKTAFNTGVNEFASRLRDTIEQVNDGQYSDIYLSCDNTGRASVAASGSQGTNNNCVFLGKMWHLTDAGSDHYEVFSVVGSRLSTPDGDPVTYPSTGSNAQVAEPLTQAFTTPQHLTIGKVTIDGSVNSYEFGFMPLNDAASTDSSTLQTTGLYYVSGVGRNTDSHTASLVTVPANLLQARKADICLTDGSRQADIIIGSNNDQLNVTVAMRSASC